MVRTWEESFAALRAIDPAVCLYMRKPGDWYVGISAEIAEGGMLSSPTQTMAPTPERAVSQCWTAYSSAKAVRVSSTKRVRWNGFMWEDVPS